MVNDNKTSTKMLPLEVDFDLQVTMNENMTNEPCFGSLSRVLTCTLTLSPWKTLNNNFQTLFNF